MPVSAHDVAAELRARDPALPRLKLHKLLYYCQAHHLATFGEPLFIETLSAWDKGPVVGQLWYAENQDGPLSAVEELNEAQLNTVGYVLSRYGALTGKDLQHLTHSEDPWRLADAGRGLRRSVRIELAWIERYFRTADDADEKDELDARAVAEWLADAEARREAPSSPDDAEELTARIAELRARVDGRG